jgi:multiple antibiotic resistance protein
MLLPKGFRDKNEFLAQSIMSELLEQAVKFFIVFFVVVEPISLIPVFSGLTEGASDSYKHKMATKSVLVASLILLIFALVGAGFLGAMGISINSFRIFGGLLLFLIALEMVFARESGTRTSSDEKVESKKRADISVFPLAFPFMAGPGALTTLLLWFGPIPVTQRPLEFSLMFLCALIVLASCLLAMWVAGPLMRVIGVTGTNVANRLFGVVLGALAVQFVVDGLRASFNLG